jgi:hypothetical protein
MYIEKKQKIKSTAFCMADPDPYGSEIDCAPFVRIHPRDTRLDPDP